MAASNLVSMEAQRMLEMADAAWQHDNYNQVGHGGLGFRAQRTVVWVCVCTERVGASGRIAC